MAELLEVKVPDIGDYKDVPVIEVFVKPGDSVGAEDSLVTIESDKATMEVTGAFGGCGEGTAREGRRQGLRGIVVADAGIRGGQERGGSRSTANTIRAAACCGHFGACTERAGAGKSAGSFNGDRCVCAFTSRCG